MAALLPGAWGAGWLYGAGNSRAISVSHEGIMAFLDGTGSVPTPVLIRAWKEGRLVASCDATSPGTPCLQDVMGARNEGAWLMVHLVAGDGPILDVPILREVSVRPGIDGLVIRSRDGSTAYLTPDQLMHMGMLKGFRPFRFIPELHLGTNVKEALKRAGLRGEVRRLKVASFLVHGDAVTTPFRFTHGVPISPKTVRQRALDGVSYMRRALFRSRRRVPAVGGRRFYSVRGQFLYQYDLLTGEAAVQGPRHYNLPRHAGTTYALANAMRVLGADVGDEVRLALEYLRRNTMKCGRGGCVGWGRRVSIGATALALVALSEYVLATGDTSYVDLGRRWADFLVSMRKENGDLYHVYDRSAHRPVDVVLPYFSGEAAFGLAKFYRVTGDRRYVETAVSVMDAITDWRGKEIPFHFAYPAEHWTCQAAWELYPEGHPRRYLEYCKGYVEYIERLQYTQSFDQYPDIWGGIGVTTIYAPHLTPSCSHGEALASVVRLQRALHDTDPLPMRQLRRILGFIIRHMKGHDCFLCTGWMDPAGAVPSSPTDWTVRIDFVQHCTTALVRSLELL